MLQESFVSLSFPYYLFSLNNLYSIESIKALNDASIIFYFKDNLEFKQDYTIKTNGGCCSVIQTKDNEICYSEKNNNSICFFDLSERKIKTSLSNISMLNERREWFLMISKDLLFIPGENKISIINVNQYRLVRIIDASGSSSITGICMLNNNMLLTGDVSQTIKQWRIEGDNLILISKKEKTHENNVNVLLNLGNGFIAFRFK